MESIGQKLHSAREDRGISIDQVARDTNISKHYLQALEEDKYEVFPAEPYVMGFLRTYSDHLGLNTEEILSQYKNFRLQEQPAPMTALLEKKNPLPMRIILIIVGVAALGGLGVLVVPSLGEFFSGLAKAGPAAPSKEKEFAFPISKNRIEERFYQGQTINVAFDKDNYKFLVKSIGPNLVLATPEGESKMKLGEELFVDLTGNKEMDLRFYLQDIVPSDPTKGVLLSIERVAKPKDLGNSGIAQTDEIQPQAAVTGDTMDPNRVQKPSVLLNGTDIKPFTLDVVFRGDAYFRFLVDDKIRQEDYRTKGEHVRIDATKRVALWISNAGAFTGKIQDTDVQLGRPGEVASKVIEYATDASGKTVLQVSPMY